MRNTHSTDTREASVVRLVVLNGSDAGRAIRLDRPRFIIGSGPTATFRLSDVAIESEHVELSVHSDGIRLRDLTGAGVSMGSLRVRDAVVTQSTTFIVGATTISIENLASVSPNEAVPSAPDLAQLPYREARALAIEHFERAYVSALLAESNNIVVHAARRAGVERESFHRILSRIRAKSGSPSLPQ